MDHFCRFRGLLLAASAAIVAASGSAQIPPPPRLPPAEPFPAAELQASIDRGVQFLLANQNPDGSWGTARQTKDLNIYAPVPGAHHAFRTATTALCISALIETGDPNTPQVQSAIERSENWLFENLPRLRRANGDALYNVWGHAYSIQALVRMQRRLPNDEARMARIKELIDLQFDLLDRYESVDGGWGYYDFRLESKKPATDSISFTTATILFAFREAQDAGHAPPQKLVDRGVAAIKRQLKPDYTYLYGEYLKYRPMHGVNQPGGSLGRSNACNLALRSYDDPKITDAVMKGCLDRLISRNGWLDMGRKRPIPHESWYAVAGYFYYYGHYYAALCVERIPEADRPYYQDHLARIMVNLQEKDGSWWDYPLYAYHQPYGTAFALMTLHRCRRP